MNRPSLPHVGVACLLLLILHASAAHAAEQANLVVNGDFAQLANGQPTNWQTAGDNNLVTQTLRVMKDADGVVCAQLSCTRYERQAASAHAMLAQVGKVRLVKGRTYEFSCRVRAEGIAGRSVAIAISDTKVWRNCGLQSQLPLTGKWKSYRQVFQATEDVQLTGRLQISYNETGTLYVADVRIVEYLPEDIQFTNVVAAAAGRNLVPNGSFELGASGWSSAGAGAGWGNLDRLHGRIENAGGAQGQSFLRIPVGGDQTPTLYFDYFEPTVRREIRPLAASEGWIRLEKGAVYTLSCFLRASRDGVPAVLAVMGKEPTGASRQHQQMMKLTTAWARYTLTFRAEHRYGYVLVGPDLQQEDRVDVDVDAVQLEKADRATEYSPRFPVELAAEPSEPGGIFYDDQAAALILRACNSGESPQQLTVKFKATDFDDQPVILPDQTMEVGPRASVRRQVPIPGHWRGFYKVVAWVTAGDATPSTELRLAIVPRRGEKDSVCGINHAFSTSSLIQLASKAGVSWYRDWSIKWQHMEPAKGEYHWELADVQIDRVLRQGPAVLPLLPPFPSAHWSSQAPADMPTTGYPGVRIRQAWGPKDPRELADFIERAVQRYKDRIHIWEFLNEPIYTDYALPGRATSQTDRKTYTPSDYVKLLETAAIAMRKADPTCKVMGGIAGPPGQLTPEVIDAGILKHVDLFNLHIYPSLRTPEAYAGEMDALLKRMDAGGGRKPIWITEFSYYAVDDLPRKPFIPRSGAWAEARLLDSERQCADYTLRFFAVMLAHGVEKIFIHSGASGKVNEPDFECALFAYGGAPRKLLPAMAVFTQVLGASPQCVGQRQWQPGGYGVGFETGKQAVLVFWDTADEPAAGQSLPTGPGLVWMDTMGRTLVGPPARFSSSPVYLLAPSGKARTLLESMGR